MNLKKLFFTTILSAVISVSAAQAAEQWPDLPVGIKSGISAQVGNKLFVGLGSAGQDVYALDLSNKTAGWVKTAPYPGPAANGAPAAVSNGKIYVFGGAGKQNKDDKAPIIFDSVFAYDVSNDAWQKLDTKSPVGLLGASAIGLSDGNIAIVGGYNKALFDKYLADIMATDKKTQLDQWNKIVNDYMGMEPSGYKWNDTIYKFNPSNLEWVNAGENPYLPNTGSAIVEMSKDNFLVINGEIKPGLRTPKVKQVNFANSKVAWQEKTQIPALAGDELQEGLAGAFAGKAGEAVLVAGGANFKGARAKAISGQWYAHEGYPKRWNSDIYAYKSNGWSHVGNIKDGLAYGASFTVDGGLLVIGGEDSKRAAHKEVFLIQYDGQKLSIVD